MSKKTAIIGASTNPQRYAYIAAQRLTQANQEIVPLGIKKGEVFGSNILDIRDKPEIKGIHTVTMYLGSQNQIDWEEYILSLAPFRIIFNPGTENPQLARKATNMGIETINACTLVMLSVGNY
ncbi:MAG: CoA-binding protein [Cyclobacteriaceae bacterium]